jgi:hypothetical protein
LLPVIYISQCTRPPQKKIMHMGVVLLCSYSALYLPGPVLPVIFVPPRKNMMPMGVVLLHSCSVLYLPGPGPMMLPVVFVPIPHPYQPINRLIIPICLLIFYHLRNLHLVGLVNLELICSYCAKFKFY